MRETFVNLRLIAKTRWPLSPAAQSCADPQRRLLGAPLLRDAHACASVSLVSSSPLLLGGHSSKTRWPLFPAAQTCAGDIRQKRGSGYSQQRKLAPETLAKNAGANRWLQRSQILAAAAPCSRRHRSKCVTSGCSFGRMVGVPASLKLGSSEARRTLNPNRNRFGGMPPAGVGVLYLAAADGKRGLG